MNRLLKLLQMNCLSFQLYCCCISCSSSTCSHPASESVTKKDSSTISPELNCTIEVIITLTLMMQCDNISHLSINKTAEVQQLEKQTIQTLVVFRL